MLALIRLARTGKASSSAPRRPRLGAWRAEQGSRGADPCRRPGARLSVLARSGGYPCRAALAAARSDARCGARRGARLAGAGALPHGSATLPIIWSGGRRSAGSPARSRAPMRGRSISICSCCRWSHSLAVRTGILARRCLAHAGARHALTAPGRPADRLAGRRGGRLQPDLRQAAALSGAAGAACHDPAGAAHRCRSRSGCRAGASAIMVVLACLSNWSPAAHTCSTAMTSPDLPP